MVWYLYVQKSANLPITPITEASLTLFTCSPTMHKLAAYCQASPFEASGRLHNPLLLRPSSLSFPRSASSGLHITSSCYKRQKRRRLKKFGSLFATDDDDINDGVGSYIDLGSTINDYNNIDAIFQNILPVSQQQQHSTTTEQPQPSKLNNNNDDNNDDTNNWRSKYWIVLIDDESSIRLAIGDYLHSMGYTMITACDGPSSFLDVLLYSCGWSFLFSSDVAEGGDGDIGDNNIPPWIIDYNDDDGSNGSSNRMLWRLPNCIISDIRMPGGVDGVQLLQLLRQQRQQLKTQSSTMGRQSSKNKKKGREIKMQKKKKSDDENEYDGKDDFELLDAIVGNGNGGGKSGGDEKNGIDRRRIVTAIDQANQKLDVISDTLAYHQESAHNNNSEQYPNSLHQIPVILLTAKAMVSDRIVGYRAGANNYLPKPFRPEELLGMVDSLMRKQERERREWMVGRGLSDLDGSGQANLVDTGERSNNANILQSYSASAQQLNDLKTELMEIKNLLKEEAMQQNKAKVELEEVEGLTRLLPEAIWMFMNGERRKRLFTSDHIRSILKFCFDDDSSSLPRKGIMKRDDLLEELERMNEEYPDRVQDYISIS